MKLNCKERCKVLLPDNSRVLVVAGEREWNKAQANHLLRVYPKQFSEVASGGDKPVSEGTSPREDDEPASARRKTKVPKFKKKGTW